MAKKIMNEAKLNNLIYKMVTESLNALSGYNFESNNNNDDDRKNDDSKKRNNRRRQQVEAFFKQPGVNPAAYAYRLYRVKPVEGDDTNDMKNARSKFMKCLNHEKNEDGYEYAFDSSEVNTLFSMISGNELKENKIRLTESDLMHMVNESVKAILKKRHLNEIANSNDEMAKQALLRNIKNPNMRKWFGYYKGEGYGGFELTTEDGWYFYCEEFGCDISLDTHSSYEPETYWSPESSSDSEGHIDAIYMDGSVIDYVMPGHDPRTEKGGKLIPDEEIEAAFNEQFEATDEELADALNKIEQGEYEARDAYYDEWINNRIDAHLGK